MVGALIVGALAGYAACALFLGRQVPLAIEVPVPSAPVIDERFDRLVRALPLGVLMLDARARVSFANRAASAIFGFEISRVLGHHIIEAIPSIELERRIEEALGGDASMGPLIVTGKSGNRTYAVSAYPLIDEHDETTGALVLAEDQTELLAIERARQEFLSNVSHELRTPLSSIKLMLETVIDSPDDDVRDMFLPQALGQVDRLVALVQKLLDQARAEAGNLRLNIERVSMTEVVRPIVQSFEPQAQAKGVTLSLNVASAPKIDLDRDRISQVIVNLVDNALRFTPNGGSVVVEVDQDAVEAFINVRDTGIGIPFKDLPHIFERFYVVDRSRAREVSGAGLGLAIVKQIVEAHKGTISVESLLRSGTKFVVRLPLVQKS